MLSYFYYFIILSKPGSSDISNPCICFYYFHPATSLIIPAFLLLPLITPTAVIAPVHLCFRLFLVTSSSVSFLWQKKTVCHRVFLSLELKSVLSFPLPPLTLVPRSSLLPKLPINTDFDWISLIHYPLVLSFLFFIFFCSGIFLLLFLSLFPPHFLTLVFCSCRRLRSTFFLAHPVAHADIPTSRPSVWPTDSTQASPPYPPSALVWHFS